MNKDTLENAIIDAERFIRIAKNTRRVIGKDEMPFTSKHTAATKRASLDLTRSLSDMRRVAG